MSEEELKAIEYLEKYIHWETYGERNLEKDIQTTLNLVKKQQEEIKKKNNMYRKEYEEHFEMKRQNGVLINNELILKREIEKKDKIIDLIAETLGKKYCFAPIQEKCNQGADDFDRSKCIPCIKQYFANKVEGSK